jgi:hypothetical protein
MKPSDIFRLLEDPDVPEGLIGIARQTEQLLTGANTVKVDIGSGYKVPTEHLIPIYERRLKRTSADTRWPIGVSESLAVFKQNSQLLTFVSCFLDEAFVVYLWIDNRGKLAGCIAGPNNSNHLDRPLPESAS